MTLDPVGEETVVGLSVAECSHSTVQVANSSLLIRKQERGKYPLPLRAMQHKCYCAIFQYLKCFKTCLSISG